jgi:LPS O-antigen subunit length determinant protein (WzzB/FepE family)
MNPNNQTIETDEIDLGEIIRKLWKDKFLILSISLIVSALAYA